MFCSKYGLILREILFAIESFFMQYIFVTYRSLEAYNHVLLLDSNEPNMCDFVFFLWPSLKSRDINTHLVKK